MSGNCHSVDKSSRGGILDATVEGHKVGMMLATDLLRVRLHREYPTCVQPRIDFKPGLPRDDQTFRLRSILDVPGP